jgi:hypothetical protein
MLIAGFQNARRLRRLMQGQRGKDKLRHGVMLAREVGVAMTFVHYRGGAFCRWQD